MIFNHIPYMTVSITIIKVDGLKVYGEKSPFILKINKTIINPIYLNINQLEALNFIMSLFHASTCFEHKPKLYYTVSGIITPIGGLPAHRLREDWFNLCTGRPPIGVMIPEPV